MSYYLLEYRYADQEQRARVRPQHLAYIEGLRAAGNVVLAGPLLDESGAVVVLRADDLAEAQRLVDGDPYSRHGVAIDVRLREWRVVVPDA